MWCVVPAAGIGSRFNAEIPKQYTEISPNITILEQTLKVLCGYAKFTGVLVVLNANDTHWSRLGISKHKKIHTCFGGENRSDSVFNGLTYLTQFSGIDVNEWVMVHDAARPGVTLDLIDELYAKVIAQDTCGGILACPIADTVKQVKKGKLQIDKTIDRSCLWLAQTPQLFKLNQLIKALNFAHKSGFQVTDEASAMEFSGFLPIVVESDVKNFKITTKNDLMAIKSILFNK